MSESYLLTFRGFNLSGLYSRSLLKSGRPALSLFRACPSTELGLQSMVGFKNENIEIIAHATWIASVFIGNANLMLSGRVFVFFSESWVSLSVWPGLPVSMRRKIQVKENEKKFLYPLKLTYPTKGRLCLWHPPPLWTTAGLHRDGPHQRGFDCLDLGIWRSLGILLFCSPYFWSRFNRRNFWPALEKQHLVFTRIKCISKAWKRVLVPNVLKVTGDRLGFSNINQ